MLIEHHGVTVAQFVPSLLEPVMSADRPNTQRRLKRLFCGGEALPTNLAREAMTAFEQALVALEHLPESRARHEQAIDIRLDLRSAFNALGDFGRRLEVLREAESVAVALDDARRLGQVLVFLARHFFVMGTYGQAITAAQRALVLATASGEVVQQALANNFLGVAYSAQGDYRRAIDCSGQGAAFFDGARRHELFGGYVLPAVNSRANLARCYAELGMFAEGRALGEEGLRIAEAVAHPASLMSASHGIGVLALHQGDLSRALPVLERAVGICHEADLPGWFPMVADALGAAYALSGRIADAESLLAQSLEQTTATDRTGTQMLCRLSLGEAQVLAGYLVEAHALAERAPAHARAHQERGHEAYALRLLGDIAARREPPEVAQAEVHYQHALALAEALGMRPLQAHGHRSLGMLYTATGQREQARTELSAAVELYHAMDMTFWLPQTEATLAQVEGR